LASLFMVAITQGIAAAPPDIAVGSRHTCGLDTRGEVFCWGDNFHGQLGIGVIEGERRHPVENVGLATSVSAGGSTSCVLSASGGVKCWGQNQSGVLGDGDPATQFRYAPADVSGLVSGVAGVSVGTGFACALTTGGAVKCWGASVNTGRPGPGSPVPVDVVGLTSGVRAIDAGNSTACAITASGGVRCWGDGRFASLGNGSFDISQTPVDVVGLSSGVAAVAVGREHTCAVLATGSVRCWGGNRNNALGNGSGVNSAVPVDVAGVSGAVSIASGSDYSCVLTGAGAVRCWGGYFSGPGGTARDVPGLATGITAIWAGPSQLCATHADGGISCIGSFQPQFITADASRVANLTPPVRSVALGDQHICAVDGLQRALCWGANTVGQLGVAYVPTRISARVTTLEAPAAAIDAGERHSCALLGNGAVKCWGGNDLGQLGDGTATTRGSPTGVVGVASGARLLAAGGNYTCALVAEQLRCWGSGELSPGAISGAGAGVQAIAVGEGFGCLLGAGGGVRCWGDNTYGQLGNGNPGMTNSPVPVDVVGLGSGVTAIGAGIGHACALLASGGVRCWGYNGGGGLGTGSGPNSAVPVSVPGFESGVRSLFAKGASTCVAMATGVIWCWGTPNGFNASPQPLNLVRLGPRAVRRALPSHTCALYDEGAVNCFGSNAVAQLGDGTRTLNRGKPASVVSPDGVSFLDLTPSDPLGESPASAFVAVTRSAGAGLDADIRYRAQDVGATGSVYVFASAPASQVQLAGAAKDVVIVGKATRADGAKADEACLLAQVSANGQLRSVSGSNLSASVSGALGAQGQSVNVLGNLGSAAVAGATFFVGYGSSASSMLAQGTNVSVVNVPGSVTCQPQAPQTGWWWNPAEGGRGFSIEATASKIFMAAYLYDDSGRATWLVASGPTSLDGSLFTGELIGCRGGQTLGGPYPGFPSCTSMGAATLAFGGAQQGTLAWPGGVVPIERMNLVPGGLAAAPQANRPENGWWWNPGESGRGFFIEWQNGYADLAGYLYDDAGNPIWLITVNPTPDARSFAGNWWQYANGQTLTGAYRQAMRISDNVAPVTVQFSSPDTAIMTLPNGRTTMLARFRF
jgi:alpha-tubulin suppressor-like RCC1 family protein